MDLELLEALALSDDRSAALAQLLPGSEDHDYYLALHAQHRGALADAEAVIAAWPKRHGTTARYDRLRLRQLLYKVAPDSTGEPASRVAADQLRDRFGVSHSHEPDGEASDVARPVRLPDGAFSPIKLLRRAVENDANLSQVTDEGIDALVGMTLDPARRRVLLGRLSHSREPQVVQLVADDLAHRGSGGFGSLAFHHQLTLDQLHALAELRPELRGATAWMEAVVTRMQPPAAIDLEIDLDARCAYLAALWQFVAELPAPAASLQAHVLWHLLDTARRRGQPIDRAAFRAYLALPRAGRHLARAIDRTKPAEIAQLGADFRAATRLPPAGSDEQLIRDVIQAQPDDTADLGQWLERSWLDAEIATAQLLTGSPGGDHHALVLGPARAQALRERVELAWCPHNPTLFAADQPVALEVDIKNVPELVVKVFRIDPLAYFQHHRRELDTAIDLGGLAASHEQVLRLSEAPLDPAGKAPPIPPIPPIRRVRRRIELAACQRPGSYVVDLIGNGMSSRAVIHKGRLRHVMRVGAAGHVITVFDDAGRPRPDARVWLGDREYVPDDRATVVVPFSTSPGRVAMLVVAGELATVAHVELVAETVALAMTLALDRQSLTAGRTVQAIARLALTIGDAPASLALLKQSEWRVTLTDRSGVATSRTQPVVLGDHDAAVLSWQLGEDTADVAIQVTGRVEVRSEQREREVSAAAQVQVAAMYAGPAIEAVYLTQGDTGWVVSALGKTGEPRAHRAVTIGVVHRWAEVELTAELATDERGRIELGRLAGARRISATLGSLTQRWELDEPDRGALLHTTAGRDAIVHVPASRTAAEAIPQASVVELRGGAPARHVAARLEPLDGAIAIGGLPAGDYRLRAPGIAATAIVVAAADAELAGWAIGGAQLVQLPRPAPVIAELAAAAPATLTVQLRGAGERTRVHAIATRFAAAPVQPIASAAAAHPGRRGDPQRAVRYVSGRELGDEYRYVLERRGQPRFPGVMLDKPGLLLNPWSRRTTSTAVARPRPGGGYGPAAAAPAAIARELADMMHDSAGDGAAFAGYDFLAAPPVVLANLVPDGAGRIAIPLAALAGAATVTVIVDDPAGMSVRRIGLAEPALAPRDLRLALALDPARHARQHKAIAPLPAGAQLVIDDLATAQVHLIDSVERAHGYLVALGGDAALREFGFVTRWHTLGDAERRALYSKYACHELHLFLYWKDRGFFDQVIRPYLAHKRTKTFIDHWLVGADLTGYLEPARLAQLNAVERALLAQRIAPDTELVRLLDDEVAVQPPDPARDTRLIDGVLGGATLDGDDQIAVASRDARLAAEQSMALPPPGPPAAPMAAGFAAPGAPPPPPRQRKRAAGIAPSGGGDDGDDGELRRDLGRRDEAAAMFRAADKTQEWAEHNWWQRTPAGSGAAMIAPSRLWRDLARALAHSAAGGPPPRFLSPWLGLATGSFAEAMCALAVTDLPFAPASHAIVSDGNRLTITAASNALAGSSQLVDGELISGGAPLVVGMTYVRSDDRHDWVNGEQVDKYTSGVLSAGVVYTCQVVVANPTSSRQRVATLVQIPRGSIAVAGARPTHTIDVVLPPYGTHGHEYSFYFPEPGRWPHFPAHVSRAGQIVAAAPGTLLEVRAGRVVPDPRSWPHVSQRGTVADVVAHLATANLAATDLTRVAWRLRDRAAYQAILGALEARRAFDPTLWGYALLHRDRQRIRAWLAARPADLLAAGPALDMLGLDAEQLGGYEHLELAPLVNARAHRLGARLQILNDGLAAQYTRFLELVAHRRAPTAEDLLAAAHYLLVQDRIAAALAILARLAPLAATLSEQLQYDYLAGYAACATGELGAARELAERWRDHPVDRWRHRFAALAGLLDELTGAAPVVADPRSRDQHQAERAAAQPAFELAVDRDGVVVTSRNVAALELRFFEMDIELLFSRQPFVQGDLARLSFIEPGHREAVVRPPPEHRVAWPAQLRGKNVVVEAVGPGARKAKVHYANDLTCNLAHQYGQIRVQRASNASPLAATYVKVYARRRGGGGVAFYKDGYTDLRGWFDYATLSTTELDLVERFAILVCSDHAGAAILEADPPAR